VLLKLRLSMTQWSEQ